MTIKRTLEIAVLLLCVAHAQAANRFWVAAGSSGTWTATSSWAATSGGAAGQTAPVATDVVVFDAAKQTPCFLNANVTVQSLTISTSATGGFTGFIDTSSRTLTVVTDFVMNRGTFYARTSSITVSNNWTIGPAAAFVANTSSVTFFATSTGKIVDPGDDLFYKLQFNGVGGGWRPAAAITVSSSVQLMNGMLSVGGSSITSVGAFNVTGGTLSIAADIQMGGDFNKGPLARVTAANSTSTVRLSGAGILSGLGSPMQMPNFDLSGAAQTTTLAGPIHILGSLTNGASHTLDPSGTNYGLTIADSLTNNGTYIVRTASITFNGTSAGDVIDLGGNPVSLLLINGSGSWSTSGGPLTVATNFLISRGTFTVVAGSSFTVQADIQNTGGAIDFQENAAINGGDITNVAGTVRAVSTATVTLTGAGTLGGTGNTILPNLTLVGAATTSLGGRIAVLGALTNNTGHTLDVVNLSNYPITLSGDWLNSGTFTMRAGSVTFNGSDANTLIRTNSSPFYNLRFNGSGSWVGNALSVNVSSSVWINSGTYRVAGSSLVVTGDIDVTAGGTLEVEHDVVINGGDLTNTGTVVSLTTPTVTLAGVGSVGGSGATILPRLTMTGAATTLLNGPLMLNGHMTNAATHILDVRTGSNYAITISSQWSNAGTFSMRAGSVTFIGSNTNTIVTTGNSPFYDLRINGTGSWAGVANAVTVANNLEIDVGTYRVTMTSLTVANDLDIALGAVLDVGNNLSVNGGDLTNAGTITNLSTSTILLSGSGLLGGAGTNALPRVTFNGAGTTTLGGPVVLFGSSTIGVGHTLDVSASDYQITISSWFANNGTFTPQQGTVVVDSSATLTGLTTFYNFVTSTPDIYLTFQARTTFYVLNALTLAGTIGDELNLRSTINGTAWHLDSEGTESITAVAVRDSDARAGHTLVPATSLDGGNNRNWNFGAGVRTWLGTFNIDWMNVNNWNTTVPTASDSVLILSSATRMPTMTVDVAISSLTILAGSSLTLNGFDLTLSSFTNIGQFLMRGNERVTTAPNGLGGSTVTYTAASGAMPILSTWTYSNLAIAGGPAAVFTPTGDITLARSLSITGGTVAHGGETFIFTSTIAAQSIRTSGDPLFHATFDGVGGYWTLQDSMTVLGTLTLSNGTLDTKLNVNNGIAVDGEWIKEGGVFFTRGSSVTFTGSGTRQRIRSGHAQFWKLIFAGPGSWVTDTEPVTVSSTVLFNAGELMVVSPSSMTIVGNPAIGAGATLNIQENMALNSGGFNNAGTIVGLSTPTVTITATGAIGGTGSTQLPSLTTTGNAQTTTLASPVSVAGSLTNVGTHVFDVGTGNFGLSVGESWTNTGTFVMRTGSVTFTGASPTATLRTNNSPFFNLRFTGNGLWTSVTNPITVSSAVWVNGGTFRVSNSSLSVTSDLDVTTGATLDINHHVLLSGGDLTNEGTVVSASTPIVTFTGAGSLGGSGTSALPQVLLSGAGTTALTGPVVFLGSATIGVGHTLDVTSGNYGITISSWFANNGTFTPQQGTVVVDSSATLTGLTTFYNFVTSTPDIYLTFQARTTFYVLNSLTLTGGVGDELNLRSTINGTAWHLDSEGTESITAVAVRDSDARGGHTLVPATSLDVGNNRNWNFGAAVRTWWGTLNVDWSNVNNWNTAVPIASDSVLIVSSATRMPTLTGDVTLSSMTLVAGSSLTLNGFNLTLTSFTNAGNVVLRGSERVTTAPNPIVGSTVTYNALTGFMPILSTWTYMNLAISGGGSAVFTPTGDVTVGRSFSMTSGILDPGYATLVFTSTMAAQSIRTSGNSLYNVTFDGPGAGVWTLQDPLTMLGTLTLVNGTLDTKLGVNNGLAIGGEWLGNGGAFVTRNSSVTFTGGGSNQRVRSGNSPFWKILFTGPGSWITDTHPLTVSSTVLVNAGTLTVVSPASMTITGSPVVAMGATLDIQENVQLNGGGFNNAGTIVGLSTATVTVTATGAIGGTGSTQLPSLTTTGNAQTTTLSGPITVAGSLTNVGTHVLDVGVPNYGLSVGENWTNTGTFTMRTGSVTFMGATPNAQIRTNNSPFFNLRFNGPGSWVSVTNPVTVSSSIWINNGTFQVANSSLGVTGDIAITSGATLDIEHHILVSGGDLTNAGTIVSASTPILTLNGAGLLGGNGTSALPQVTLSGAGTTALTGPVVFLGSATIGAGHTLDVTTGNYGITISSWFANNGTFTPQQGTVVVDSSATLTGLTTFYDFVTTVPDIYLTFQARTTFYVLNSLTLTGTLGNELNLRSTINGTAWHLDSEGTESVTAIAVRDSDARLGHLIQAIGSLDGGNNRNWNFGGGALRTWWGTVNTDWSNVNNWNTAVPTASDSVLIVSTATRMPTLDVDVVVSSVNVLVGSSLTLNGYRLALSSFTNAGHVLLRGSEGVSVAPNALVGSTVTYNALSGSVPILSTWTYMNLGISGGASAVFTPTGNITLARSLTITGGTLAHAGETFIFTSTMAAQSIRTSGDPLYHVTFDGPSGYWTLQDSMTVLGTLTLENGTLDTKLGANFGLALGGEWLNNAGTFVMRNSSLTFVGTAPSLRIRSGNSPFWKVLFAGSGSWLTDTDPLTISSSVFVNGGTFRVAGSSLSVGSDLDVTPGATLTIDQDLLISGGDLTNDGTVMGFSTATLTLVGAGSLGGTGSTILPRLATSGAGTTLLNGPIALQGQMTNGASHVLDVRSGSNYAITLSSQWANAGTFTMRAGSVTFTGSALNTTIVSNHSPFYDLRFNGAGSWSGITNAVTVANNLAIDAGTYHVLTTSLTVVGNADVGAATVFDVQQNFGVGGAWTNAGEVSLKGTEQFTKVPTNLTGSTITYNATSGTAPLLSTWTYRNLLIDGPGGIFTTSGAVVVAENMTVSAGQLSVANSTFSFTGTTGQRFDPRGAAFGVLVDSNTSASGVLFVSSVTARRLYVNTSGLAGGTTLYFQAGSTFTVTSLFLNGASGKMVTLRSMSGGQVWMLQNAGSQSLSFVDVQDSIASGNTILAGMNSVDSGNNTRWIFISVPEGITNLLATALPTGEVRLTWSAPLDADDNPLGGGSQYAIQWSTYSVLWSTSNIADTGHTATQHVYIATSGVSAGDGQVYISTGLRGGIAYYFRAWTMDPGTNWSGLSNIATGTVVSIIAVTLSESGYNFGSVHMNASTISTSAIVVTNLGNVDQTYSLAVDTTGVQTVWSMASALPTSMNRVALFGAFNATQPLMGSFGAEDILVPLSVPASGTVFSVGGETGLSVPASFARTLWFKLDMPTTTSTLNPQQLKMTITATSP